ncbi:hypothetical protein ACFVHB_02940 [Kitasatospora sp. NPDC127111]|uniref:hypothetical protein n=1 Tax=Kitasatospora sp. NPDC127111 TaxID=3345363 RepID=UPI003641B103
MFELLPGTGLALPRNAGVVRFGASERAAQWAVSTLADVRETWVCQAGWAFTACYEGVDLLLYGDCADRLSRPDRDRPGLAAVSLRRCEAAPTRPSAVPVVLADVDLFGYPAAEVLATVGLHPHPAVRLSPAPSPNGYLPEVWFSVIDVAGPTS